MSVFSKEEVLEFCQNILDEDLDEKVLTVVKEVYDDLAVLNTANAYSIAKPLGSVIKLMFNEDYSEFRTEQLMFKFQWLFNTACSWAREPIRIRREGIHNVSWTIGPNNTHCTYNGKNFCRTSALKFYNYLEELAKAHTSLKGEAIEEVQ